MDPRYQVKQYVGQVVSSAGKVFQVLETGDARYYQFRLMRDGCDTLLHFPVRKTELKMDVRRALKNVGGYVHPEAPPDLVPPEMGGVRRRTKVPGRAADT